MSLLKILTNKNLLIAIIIALVLPFSSFFLLWVLGGVFSSSSELEGCPRQTRNIFGQLDYSYIECRNNLYMLRWLQDRSLYLKSAHSPLPLISNIKHYTFKEDFLFVEGMPAFESTDYRDSSRPYLFKFKESSEPIIVSSKEDIPEYAVIDINTADGILYKTLEEMPENHRIIFEELEREAKRGDD